MVICRRRGCGRPWAHPKNEPVARPPALGQQIGRLALALLLLVQVSGLWAQGTIGGLPVSSMQTGAGQSIATLSQVLNLPASGNLSLDFYFGFGTSEAPAPEQFFDSFSGTLQVNGDPDRTALYFTVDANDVAWAPPTPGAVLLNPVEFMVDSQISHTLGAAYPRQWIFHVSLPVPPSFNGSEATFYWDLVDNQNPVISQVWLSSIVVVSEPGSLVLLGVGLVLIWRRRRS